MSTIPNLDMEAEKGEGEGVGQGDKAFVKKLATRQNLWFFPNKVAN